MDLFCAINKNTFCHLYTYTLPPRYQKLRPNSHYNMCNNFWYCLLHYDCIVHCILLLTGGIK